MHSTSLQSTWESQRSRQKQRFGTGYLNHANDNDNDHKSSGYGNTERIMTAKSLLAGNGSAALNFSELPNLKVPQISIARSGLTATGNHAIPSPRNASTGREGMEKTVGRKYRGSSRQHKSRRHHSKYSDTYNSNSNDSSSSNAMKSAGQSTLGASAEQQMFPHIAGSQNSSGYGNSGLRKINHSSPNATSILPTASSMGATNSSYPIVKETQMGNLLINTEERPYSAVTSIRGMKPGNPNWINQDNFFVAERFDDREMNIYCVLDGHGEHGHLVSRRCREYFPQFIKSSNLDIENSFNMMQNDLNSSELDVRCSGATCVMAVITPAKVAVYNCGDSRAVLGRRNPNGSIYALALSKDHKPDKPEERKRILSCGGHLGCRQVLVNQGGRGPVSMPVGPCRVWYQHRGETLGLAMSRSLGDGIVHKCGVSAEPELIERMMDDMDEFLIIATDGVWDVVDNNHAVQMVHNFALRSVNWSPIEAANSVCKFARSRWEKLSPMIDDITCIVIKIHR